MSRLMQTTSAIVGLLLATEATSIPAALGADNKTYTVEQVSGTLHERSFTVDASELSTVTKKTFTISARVSLEVDRMTGIAAIPTGQVPPAGGAAFDLEGIFDQVAITVVVDNDDTNIPDLSGPGNCYSTAELTSLLNDNRDQTPPTNGNWNVWAGMVTCHDLGALGIMWRTTNRDAFAVFDDAFSGADKDEKILRTSAHELGHALNLYHDDGDDQCSGSDTGTTIMNQTGNLDTNWGYGWSVASRNHFNNDPDASMEPGTSTAFCACTGSHVCGYNGC